MNRTFTLGTQAKEDLLAALARQGLMTRKLASVDANALYGINESWQIAYLRNAGIVEIQDSDAFETAARDPDTYTILVPKTAAMTREIAERILARNGQSKTVFWEM